MKENKYDDEIFFHRYSQMSRSTNGLTGAGEWHVLKTMLPDFKGKCLLDLGCGFGWHCKYAVERGARKAIGIDISKRMIKEAKERNASPKIHYTCMAIEDFEFPLETFDVVISSLTFHYLESFTDICMKVHTCLKKGGTFVFSVEHPIFTAQGTQDWIYDSAGEPLYWPVDHYFTEGKREACFLGEPIAKFHKTLTTYVNSLLQAGFEITQLKEPEPDMRLMETVPEMKNELRRPMMLLISAVKK